MFDKTRVSHKSVGRCCIRVSDRVSDKSIPQKCPTRVSRKSVLQGCPTSFFARVSTRVSVIQEYHTRVSYKSFPQECPSCKSVLKEWPTRVSYKSLPQECPARVFDESALPDCPTRLFRKSVGQECPTTQFHKSVRQECPTRVPHKSLLQECPTRVSCKGVPQDFPTRVSHTSECHTRVPHKSVLQEFSRRVSRKSVAQEWPTRVSYKSFPQECPTRVSQECYKSALPECPTRLFTWVLDKSVPRVFCRSVWQECPTRASYKVLRSTKCLGVCFKYVFAFGFVAPSCFSCAKVCRHSERRSGWPKMWPQMAIDRAKVLGQKLPLWQIFGYRHPGRFIWKIMEAEKGPLEEASSTNQLFSGNLPGRTSWVGTRPLNYSSWMSSSPAKAAKHPIATHGPTSSLILCHSSGMRIKHDWCPQLWRMLFLAGSVMVCCALGDRWRWAKTNAWEVNDVFQIIHSLRLVDVLLNSDVAFCKCSLYNRCWLDVPRLHAMRCFSSFYP